MHCEISDIVALAKAGQFERALEIFEHALKVSETIDDPVKRLEVLESIKAAEQKAGKGEARKR